MYNNPSLREEPRHKPAAIVSSEQQISILDWLESTGRLIAREPNVPNTFDLREEDEELQEFIAGDDAGYLDDDDDDDASTDDEDEL